MLSKYRVVIRQCKITTTYSPEGGNTVHNRQFKKAKLNALNQRDEQEQTMKQTNNLVVHRRIRNQTSQLDKRQNSESGCIKYLIKLSPFKSTVTLRGNGFVEELGAK